jgi:hypothetical protein
MPGIPLGGAAGESGPDPPGSSKGRDAFSLGSNGSTNWPLGCPGGDPPPGAAAEAVPGETGGRLNGCDGGNPNGKPDETPGPIIGMPPAGIPLAGMPGSGIPGAGIPPAGRPKGGIPPAGIVPGMPPGSAGPPGDGRPPPGQGLYGEPGGGAAAGCETAKVVPQYGH